MYPAIAALLAQTRPANTSAAAGFTAPAGQSVEVTLIVVANTTGSAVDASIFHDDAGGSTFDQTTALYYAVAVPGNSTLTISAKSVGTGFVLSPGAQLGVQTGTANALNFSIYGALESRARGVGA